MFEDPSGLTNWTRQPLRQEICSLVVGARESPSGFPEVLDEAGGERRSKEYRTRASEERAAVYHSASPRKPGARNAGRDDWLTGAANRAKRRD